MGKYTLGPQQRWILRNIVHHGYWHRGCEWNPYAAIEPVVESLERRGLVKREQADGRRIYRATEAGTKEAARDA